MRYLLIIYVFLFTAVAYGNEVVSTLLSKAAEKAEQKAELAVNDMFNNVEIDLSGFYNLLITLWHVQKVLLQINAF